MTMSRQVCLSPKYLDISAAWSKDDHLENGRDGGQSFVHY